MTDPHAKRRFCKIETQAKLADGRSVCSTKSYPRGVGKDVYDAADRALVKAFGSENSRTIGTFYDPRSMDKHCTVKDPSSRLLETN